ncbi:MAG: hypothetical protein IPN98_04995 [Propionivibrio sp.]|nr:hypothetical protein [Propionivibrio sp.]
MHETLDKGHGRIETRRCTAVGELDWLNLLGLKARWPKLASVACVESTRDMGGKLSTEKRYVISSLPADSRHPACRALTGASRTACIGVWT